MATFKIHLDQENCLPETVRPKQQTNDMAAQQKRSALGVLDCNKANKTAANKGKQPLKPKHNGKAAEENKKNVVLPVAQFEAFTVWESEEYKVVDERLKQISRSNVYKGTAEDRFITKTELAEMASRQEKENRQSDPVPMSVEKDLEDVPTVPSSPLDISMEKINDESCLSETKDDLLVDKSRAKDAFFEMEEYRNDIYCYLREREMKHRPKAGYISKQPDVTENMRAVLVDWLVEVAEEYKMHTETLYLAVNFIDRFLSYMSVVRAKLQLVGTAAMYIAAKYEEIYPPDVNEFVYITDDTYDKSQVIRMEQLILKVLGFDLSVPTPLTLISAMCVSVKLDKKTMFLAMYFSELSLLDVEQHLLFLPSVLAAASVALAKFTLGQEVWDEELTNKTGYTLNSMRSCIEFLDSVHRKAPDCPQRAIQDKYKGDKFLRVADIKPAAAEMRFDQCLDD